MTAWKKKENVSSQVSSSTTIMYQGRFFRGELRISGIFFKGDDFFLGFKTGVNFFRLGKRISDLDDDTLHNNNN